MTAHNDLASGGLLDTFTPEQIFMGEKPLYTNNGVVAVGAATKYMLMAKAADDTIHPFVPGTDTIPMAVIAAQPGAVGAHIPFFETGCFNYALVTIAAGDGSLNTLAKAKGAFNGQSGLSFDQLALGA